MYAIRSYYAPLFGTTSSGYTILAGGIVLSVMCIPYILNMLIEVFNTIPLGLKEASLVITSYSIHYTKLYDFTCHCPDKTLYQLVWKYHNRESPETTQQH